MPEKIIPFDKELFRRGAILVGRFNDYTHVRDVSDNAAMCKKWPDGPNSYEIKMGYDMLEHGDDGFRYTLRIKYKETISDVLFNVMADVRDRKY